MIILSMTLSPRQVWLGVALGIVGLAMSYTVALFMIGGTDAFAASVSCPGKETCTGENCLHKEACKNGNCAGDCQGCAGKAR